MSRYIIVGKLLYKILAIQQIYVTTPNLCLWSCRNRVPCGLVYILFSASHTRKPLLFKVSSLSPNIASFSPHILSLHSINLFSPSPNSGLASNTSSRKILANGNSSGPRIWNASKLVGFSVLSLRDLMASRWAHSFSRRACGVSGYRITSGLDQARASQVLQRSLKMNGMEASDKG